MRLRLVAKLISNRMICKLCDTEIESIHRHHFVECPCGNLFVDGGISYQRFGYIEPNSYEDTSIWVECEL